MTGERDNRAPAPDRISQQFFLLKTGREVLEMMVGVDNVSEEDRRNVGDRVAGLALETRETPVVKKLILACFDDREISPFHVVVVLDRLPSAVEPDPKDPEFEKKQVDRTQLIKELGDLQLLLKRYLWGGVPMIYSTRALARNIDGMNGEEYLRMTNPRARYLGEVVPLRIAALPDRDTSILAQREAFGQEVRPRVEEAITVTDPHFSNGIRSGVYNSKQTGELVRIGSDIAAIQQHGRVKGEEVEERRGVNGLTEFYDPIESRHNAQLAQVGLPPGTRTRIEYALRKVRAWEPVQSGISPTI